MKSMWWPLPAIFADLFLQVQGVIVRSPPRSELGLPLERGVCLQREVHAFGGRGSATGKGGGGGRDPLGCTWNMVNKRVVAS